MRTWLIPLLILFWSFAVSAPATASCALDEDRLSELALQGKDDEAKAMLTAFLLRDDCGCDNRDTACIRLGREGSDSYSVSQILDGYSRLVSWQKSLSSTCGAMPENSDRQRTDKITCHEKRAEAFVKDSTIPAISVFSKIAQKLEKKYTAALRSYFTGKENSRIKAERESLANRLEQRADAIAKQICKLMEDKRTMETRLSNVKRHNRDFDHILAKKIIRIEYNLKKLQGQIDQLKLEYETVKNAPFYPMDWCSEGE